MKYKMIIMDLDGTLLRKDKTISEYTKKIIRGCQKRGVKIIFATARPERTTLVYEEQLEPDAVVSNNGAKIRCKDENIQLYEIRPIIAKEIISQLLDKKMFICIDYDGYSLTNCPDYHKWENWNAIYTPDFAEFDSTGIQKISVRATNLDLFSDIDFGSYGCNFYANQSDSWYMITDNNASKAKAISVLADCFNVHQKTMVAFGDDLNDMEMLQLCGIGVAMENSIQDLKLCADYTCLTNEQDGVALWIEKNLF